MPCPRWPKRSHEAGNGKPCPPIGGVRGQTTTPREGLMMIVHPDFPEHWKTRLLIAITGDESAPMAVLRLWAHCQHSRQSHFPTMTGAQLASICHWGDRKPACHTALIKAGFVDKLSPKGFAAHEWNE